VGHSTMVSPDLMNVETMSVLRRLEAGGMLTRARAAHALVDLERAPLRRVPTAALLRPAWALRSNVSSYDACYVALAQQLGCPLVTADLRLVRGAGGTVPIVAV